MRVIKKWIFPPQIDRQNCIFCNYNFKNEEPIHYEDQKYYVITDIQQASSQKHLLVITKEHINNALEVKDTKTLNQMQTIGQKILSKICQTHGLQKQFRFGFHLPPFNSIDHLHLHCFVEPLTAWKYNSLHYGWLLNSVSDILQKIDKNKS